MVVKLKVDLVSVLIVQVGLDQVMPVPEQPLARFKAPSAPVPPLTTIVAKLVPGPETVVVENVPSSVAV